MKQFSKVRANLNRPNHVYIISSKHSYRPMRARVAPKLLHKSVYFSTNAVLTLYTYCHNSEIQYQFPDPNWGRYIVLESCKRI